MLSVSEASRSSDGMRFFAPLRMTWLVSVLVMLSVSEASQSGDGKRFFAPLRMTARATTLLLSKKSRVVKYYPRRIRCNE